MEFTLIKEGVPSSDIEHSDDMQISRWFSILSEMNKIKNEEYAKQMRMQ